MFMKTRNNGKYTEANSLLKWALYCRAEWDGEKTKDCSLGREGTGTDTHTHSECLSSSRAVSNFIERNQMFLLILPGLWLLFRLSD